MIVAHECRQLVEAGSVYLYLPMKAQPVRTLRLLNLFYKQTKECSEPCCRAPVQFIPFIN